MANRLSALWRVMCIMMDRRSSPIGLACLAMSVLYGICYVMFTDQLSKLQTAVIENNNGNRIASMIMLTLVIMAGAISAALMLYTGDLLINVAWRRRLAEHISERYFQARVAFRLTQIDGRIADADQRIGADTTALCVQLKMVLIGAPMFLGVIPLLTTITAFCVKLWIALGFLAPLLSFVLCALFLLVNYVLMRRPQALSKLNAKSGGIYRFMHTYIRLQSESIALLGGHDRERQRCQALMQTMSEHTSAEALSDIALNANSNLFYWGAGTASAVIPFVSAILSGASLPGTEAYLASAGYIQQMLYEMAVVALLSRDFSQLCALAERLDELLTVLDELVASTDAQPMLRAIGSGGEADALLDANEIAFDQVTLRTPAGRLLFPHGMTFCVAAGGRHNVLIMGPNGIGKSSLFRALGDLWPVEAGRIRKPTTPGAVFFVPQRPFLSFGTMREQIAYPEDGANLDDKTARRLLETVRLTARCSDELDAVAMWPEILSGGEQQRLGIARLLYHKPRFAVLDESTSAMDEQTEIHVYETLAGTGTGLLSIGHRSTIRRFHHAIVVIDDNGDWTMLKDV